MSTVVGTPQTFGAGAVIPVGNWVSDVDFDYTVPPSNKVITSPGGKTFYSSGTSLSNKANQHAAPITITVDSPPIQSAPVPPSVAGIQEPRIQGGPPAEFPKFTPVMPPPPIGEGGGPPPAMPPPHITPPPGVLVGPVVKPAAVPPSVAGFPLIRFKSGNATSPPQTFPLFTTHPPSPPVAVPNIFTGGKPPVTPPSTPSEPPFHPPSEREAIPPPEPVPEDSTMGDETPPPEEPPANGRRRRRKPV